MARYRRYRRTIVRAPKKKWASNMIPISSNLTNVNISTDPQNPHYVLFGTALLAENKTETTSPTPVIIKTGNFRAQIDAWGSLTSTSPMVVYIVYIPEGFGIDAAGATIAMIRAHPEWVMGWKIGDASGWYATSGQADIDFAKLTVSSRLKRNLNSGDKIYLVAYVDPVSSGNLLTMHGMVQFWSCAN